MIAIPAVRLAKAAARCVKPSADRFGLGPHSGEILEQHFPSLPICYPIEIQTTFSLHTTEPGIFR